MMEMFFAAWYGIIDAADLLSMNPNGLSKSNPVRSGTRVCQDPQGSPRIQHRGPTQWQCYRCPNTCEKGESIAVKFTHILHEGTLDRRQVEKEEEGQHTGDAHHNQIYPAKPWPPNMLGKYTSNEWPSHSSYRIYHGHDAQPAWTLLHGCNVTEDKGYAGPKRLEIRCMQLFGNDLREFVLAMATADELAFGE